MYLFLSVCMCVCVVVCVQTNKGRDPLPLLKQTFIEGDKALTSTFWRTVCDTECSILYDLGWDMQILTGAYYTSKETHLLHYDIHVVYTIHMFM